MTKKTTERAKKDLLRAATETNKETLQVALQYIMELEKALIDANQYKCIRSDSWYQLQKKAEQLTEKKQDTNVRILLAQMDFITAKLLYKANYHEEKEQKIVNIQNLMKGGVNNE